jgi:hypothetical protein
LKGRHPAHEGAEARSKDRPSTDNPVIGSRPLRDEYLIVEGGKLAGTGAHSYSEGDATGGSEEAAKFRR